MKTLTRRERQILDILYAGGRATAAEIQAAMPDPPSYSSVRALLRILEGKGHVRHELHGPRYVYAPTVPPARARKSAARHLVDTFFQGSPAEAVVALLDDGAKKLTEEDLARIEAVIERARKGGSS